MGFHAVNSNVCLCLVGPGCLLRSDGPRTSRSNGAWLVTKACLWRTRYAVVQVWLCLKAIRVHSAEYCCRASDCAPPCQCFFSIELPPYSTEQVMRQRLLTAIHFGIGGILNL